MGFRSFKIYVLSLLAAFLALPSQNALAGREDAGVSAVLNNFILPEYHKGDNRLQCILYGDRAINQGAFITLSNPLLDIVHSNVIDINFVSKLQGVKLYPLGISNADLLKFWKDKKHSRALISSPSATYDRTTRMLRGDEAVSLRSEEIDIDGVGFDANEETRFIHIRSKVKVTVRPEMRKSIEPQKVQTSPKPDPTNSGKDPVK